MVELMNKLIRIQRQLVQDLGRTPLPEEIAAEMDMPVDKIEHILKLHTQGLTEPLEGWEDIPIIEGICFQCAEKESSKMFEDLT